MQRPVVSIEDVVVTYRSKRRRTALTSVQGMSLEVGAGEFVGLVGESGSGKSTLANAVLRLLTGGGEVDRGRVSFNGEDLLMLSEESLRTVRWRDIAVVLQSSMNALNPVATIRTQFRDVIRAHRRSSWSEQQVDADVSRLLSLVKIDPKYASAYPHELSGGMKQRVAIALALVLDPRLVIMDEPTTGLDVIIEHEILSDLRDLQGERGFAVLLISHDLGTVLEVADRVVVAYAGRIVEDRPAKALLNNPLHPYTRALLDCYADPGADQVRITYIPGQPPNMAALPPGCPFWPRCAEAEEKCQQGPVPPLTRLDGGGLVACHHAGAGTREGADPNLGRSGAVYVKSRANASASHHPVITVTGVYKTYRRNRLPLVALNDVSLTLPRGTVTALVGGSGSGKSTLARLITGMERPDRGTIRFDGRDIPRLGRRGLHAYRQHVQMVFQDPFAALNPMNTVGYTLLRPFVNYGRLSSTEAFKRVRQLLEQVGLTPADAFVGKRTSELSGGQAQRVVVAKALAVNPDVLVADEPISMLDVSIRAGILRLLDDLRAQRGFTLLYITHDLLSARLLADQVIVLHRGEIVEQGLAADVIQSPQHEYTRLLLRSIPNPRRRTLAAESKVSP